MRNRVLHDALRDFALESASLLTDDLRDGAEVEFDVIEDAASGRGGPILYLYKPRIEAFIGERWARLRELPACAAAAAELGAGATMWLRVNGLRGEQAEPALRAMLERLYEDATSFGFPEERFERLYQEVEVTLYHDAVHARVVAPLRGAAMAAERVDLGGGLSLVRGDLADAPPEAVWPDPLEDGAGDEEGLAEFFAAVDAADPPRTVTWALDRFEMGSARGKEAEALSDYLLALRALLDATSDAGEASLALRVAALCAEEGRRRLVQRRVEAAIALERFVMGGGPRSWSEGDSPAELVRAVEDHLRALLRDVLCGYLDSDLKGVADDILLETNPEPFMEIEARDLRVQAAAPPPEPEPEPKPAPEPDQDTAELDAVTVQP